MDNESQDCSVLPTVTLTIAGSCCKYLLNDQCKVAISKFVNVDSISRLDCGMEEPPEHGRIYLVMDLFNKNSQT